MRGGGGSSGEGGGGESGGVGAAHFFGGVRVNSTKRRHKSVCGPLRGNMWEYGLIAYSLVRGGHPGASYYLVIGKLRTVPCWF